MFITRHDHRYKSSKKHFETDGSVIHQGCGFLAQATQKQILIEYFSICCKQFGILNVKNLFIFKCWLYYELIQ